MSDLIHKGELFNALANAHDKGEIFAIIQNAPAVDAVPVDELLKLRDWLYESDGITMGGLRSLNEVIAKYSTKELQKIETGYERRNNVREEK